MDLELEDISSPDARGPQSPPTCSPGSSGTAVRSLALDAPGKWPLAKAQNAIIIAGCLAMAYTQLTMSPATIEFARDLGAGGLHIGILGALPTGMLFMQFIAAVVANHLRYRRGLWTAVCLVQRVIFIPLALMPFLFPNTSDWIWVWTLIVLTAVNHGMMHFSTPLWLSWMGDYLPHDGLSRYWGVRQLWMQWTAAGSLLFAAVFLLECGWPVRPAFGVLIGIGAVFGVADILIFLKVHEPPVTPAPEPDLAAVLKAPFQHAGFRSFIAYSCFWNFAAMVGAPFISLYLLAHIGMDLFQVMLLWAFSWVGGACLSQRLGHMCDVYGNRPVLILATIFKCELMIALLLVPARPNLTFAILLPIFMFDALLNTAIAIASNGFLLKNSPAGNRSMYIAAGTALAGMVGGITSIVAGGVLEALDGWRFDAWGLRMDNFHLLFAVSVLLRLACVPLVRRVKEPAGRGATRVMMELVGATPLRFMRFPVGLYNSQREDSSGTRPPHYRRHSRNRARQRARPAG